jgi:hypothetical protein
MEKKIRATAATQRIKNLAAAGAAPPFADDLLGCVGQVRVL